MKLGTIAHIVVGAALIVAGVVFLGIGMSGVTANFWIACVIVLAGVFTVQSSASVGLSVMGVGLFMLLRELGIVQTPWLSYGLGVFLIVVGIYGIVVRKNSPVAVVSQQPKTPAK
ncbi:hypothetical protein I8H83_01450 [Candidatus Saccharibacteria bacterium]|nr:hypothetical protein [Candidatus Saccharibacteria bacterium]